jgi:hypothetical protein
MMMISDTKTAAMSHSHSHLFCVDLCMQVDVGGVERIVMSSRQCGSNTLPNIRSQQSSTWTAAHADQDVHPHAT